MSKRSKAEIPERERVFEKFLYNADSIPEIINEMYTIKETIAK